MEGRVGIVRPTFEEYPNRYQGEIVCYWPKNDDYRYTAQDLIRYFTDNLVENLILINPDNPSGNYIPRSDLIELINWTKEKSINLVIDESFADFSDEEDNTLFDMSLLETAPHLYVVKSISKSFGVPGLRLGVLATGNESFIAAMKQDVAIWNINSFAEFRLL